MEVKEVGMAATTITNRRAMEDLPWEVLEAGVTSPQLQLHIQDTLEMTVSLVDTIVNLAEEPHLLLIP